MTKVYVGKEFFGLSDRRSGALFSDIVLRRCEFRSCDISITLEPENRSTIRNINVEKCKVTSCTVWPAIIEDVAVNGLLTSGGPFDFWDCAFKHVTFSGALGVIRMVNTLPIGPADATPEKNAIMSQVLREYYKSVDWALDISKGEFRECDIRGVPARLIKRDPETQVVVTRAKVLASDWRNMNLGTWVKGSIDIFLWTENPDDVMVAPKRAKEFYEYMEGLDILRKTGIAEPD